ncbi:MAG: BamA/TamA family outer membrane protein [Bacteroidales bacterium]|jgi:outer membrane protein assembly factor BamA|nr:BamA/TamA family outer membrane protein [Bacteroidales bacterium]
MKLKPSVIFIFVLLFSIVTSCVSPKKVQREGLLLDRNRIKTDNKSISIEELEGFIHQQPNQKFLGLVRLNTFFYERFKPKWVKETLGKKPVILDRSMVGNSMREMELYMAAKGYFHAEVDSCIHTTKRTAKVVYSISSGLSYTLRNISYSIKDEQLAGYVLSDSANSKIRPGSNYDAYLFDDERHRITNFLRDQGYYFFNNDYILFKVDSNLQSNQMDVIVEFQQPWQRDKETNKNVEKRHLRYKINDTYINTDFRFIPDRHITFDTLTILQDSKDPNNHYKHNFLFKEKLRLTPPTIDRVMFLRGGSFYGLDNANLTYNRISNLPIVRFVNMSFEPIMEFQEEGCGMLNCFIDIGRNPVKIFTIEAEGTNTGGFLGMGANISYGNRNLFRGSEVLSVKIKNGLEMQRSLGEATPFFLGFNTIETGVELRLSLPRLLLPVKQQRFAHYAMPGTTMATGLNFQHRPDYTRYIMNASFGYEWRESATISHTFIPAELNLVRIDRSDRFTEWLQTLKDPRLKYQYTNHLVPLSRYIFIFNNQPIRKNRDFIFVRTNIEESGNIFRLTDKLFNTAKTEEGYYTTLGVRYTQFVRLETDFRYYKFLNPKSNLVFRFAGGVGVPFGNSDVLPVEKGFYAGGANGNRGWEIRSLGPGSFSDPENVFDKMGELWLESNIEYRFHMYSFLHGAMFADIGNIWLLNENIDFPGGKFEISNFNEQIAVSSGFGLRFDFSFFIFRIDGAIKVKDPAKQKFDRWVDLSKFQIRDIVWNLGIGYPF